MADPTKEKTRLNISIEGDDADLLKQLQAKLNQKLMMNLSIPQIVKRLIKQAAATEL